MDINDVSNLDVDGVDPSDYPDFSDAFFTDGEINGRPLTNSELDKLTDDYPELLNEMAQEHLR